MLNTKVHLLTFSGTGNTRAISNMIAEEFTEKNWEVINIPAESYMKNPSKYNIPSGDLIGIGFPIYGLGEPLIVKNLVDLLPNASHKTTFLFLTAADFSSINHNASRKLKTILLKKGYSVVYERIIVMGSNWLIKYPESVTKQLHEVAKRKTHLLVTDVLNGKTKIMNLNIFLRLFTGFLKILERYFGAKLFGLSLKNNNDCDLCKKCVTLCPMDNISLKNDKLNFGKNCIMCMRCVYGCDKQSIHSRGLNLFIHKKQYNLKAIVADDHILVDYIKKQTKGFYKHFNKYIESDEL